MKNLSHIVSCALGALLLCSCISEPEIWECEDSFGGGSADASAFEGYWEKISDDGKPTGDFLGLLDSKISIYKDKVLFFLPASYSSDSIFLGFDGDIPVKAQFRDGNLVLEDMFGDGRSETYRRLDKKPDELVIKPCPLGKVGEVPVEKAQEVQSLLQKRLTLDQQVRIDRERRGDMRKVDRENTEYLKKLVAEFGWIDVIRFGPNTSSMAFVLVQHSPDLSLVIAVLPEIEKDVKAKFIDPQGYAALYDKTSLNMGVRQKYGTQYGKHKDGGFVLLPVQGTREEVENRRREIGLFPLSMYFSILEKNYNQKVRFTGETADNSGEGK